MKKLTIGLLMVFTILVNMPTLVFAKADIQVYPLKALFIVDKAKENRAFMKAMSAKGNSENDRQYAISRFYEVFTKKFPNSVTTINDQNKYTSFVAYLQIPRVSQYKIQKTGNLVDLYLPMTMTISFANMVTGEVLYTYTYTYWTKRESTVSSLNNEKTTIDLYRETYNALLEKVLTGAKQNFKPFSVEATIKKEWNGMYILGRGNANGIAKGDTLISPKGIMLNVFYAAESYSVALPIMGAPKTGMVFSKTTNGNLDELKKPKVMLMRGTTVNMEEKQTKASADKSTKQTEKKSFWRRAVAYVKAKITKQSAKTTVEDYTKNISDPICAIKVTTIPQQMIYQLFVNALGKNAAFSLISIDRSFYDAQKVTTTDTGLSFKITQERELPDYYLRLQFNGPVSVTLPSNKPDVRYDEHSVRACGDLLDRTGRVLYGKCVDEKITDEVVAGIRFSQEDRQEVVIKNALIKLADNFTKAVKFKQFKLPVQSVTGDMMMVLDKAGLLPVGSNAYNFRDTGNVEGIGESVYVPTWLLNVTDRKEMLAGTNLVGSLTKAVPRPSTGDIVLLESIVEDVKDPLKRFMICEKAQAPTSVTMSKDVYYSVVEGLKYPLYDYASFNSALNDIKVGGNFKTGKYTPPPKTSGLDYCIEPVTKMTIDSKAQKSGYTAYKCGIVAGIKVYKNNQVIWKQGMQQNVSINCPVGADEEYLNYQLSKAIYTLMADVSKKVAVP